ncbi:unnamed protein product [Closterium sp. NIES-54]
MKYLTSTSLLQLELRDGSFRRQFLVQCLILLEYLMVSLAQFYAVLCGAAFEFRQKAASDASSSCSVSSSSNSSWCVLCDAASCCRLLRSALCCRV